MADPVFAAVDVGASGGRVMAGTLAGDRPRLVEVHRFANGIAAVDGALRWDIDAIERQVRVGLDRLPDAASIGIDTWAIDYGLLDEAGTLLAPPIAYRDDRTAAVIDEVHRLVPPADLYAANGLQFLPFTTIYQLAAEQRDERWERTHRAVLIPDLLAHRLTGQLGTETTNASTTGLLDVRTRRWSTDLFDRLGLPRDLFPPLDGPGDRRGTTDRGTPVTSVASHDTASAVVGVPATTDRFAYVASGTWSLVGLETPAPVLSTAAREANFTNEAGADGRTRFLRNVGGLWLLQECLRTWGDHDLGPLLGAAAALGTGGPRIDVDDAALIAPGDMPDRIARAAGRPRLTAAETTRCILDSLAAAYARTVHQAADLAGAAVDVVHVVGGGSQNELLCQLTADAARLPVIAGPTEATAFGNLLVQARALGAAPASLDALRAGLAASVHLRRYQPA